MAFKSLEKTLRHRARTSSENNRIQSLPVQPANSMVDASDASPFLAATTMIVDQLAKTRPSSPSDMKSSNYHFGHTIENDLRARLSTRQQIDPNTQSPQPQEPLLRLNNDTQRTSSHEHNSRPISSTAPDSQDCLVYTDLFALNPLRLQRPGSIYTLSRASFANQLAQLTSLQLPDAESLSGKIAAIPTASSAVKALIFSAEQIKGWVHKATEVIDGLDSDDDIEWAAAGGREGLNEVEDAIARFEDLVKVYITAIEELQLRSDINSVFPTDNRTAVDQMEIIVEKWKKIHVTLQSVKIQVEIAMEWEELWDQVLGDIQSEMDELCRLVFELEERRHNVANGEEVDIKNIETAVEENANSQPVRLQAGSRFSFPTFPLSPSSPRESISQDDSSLLALFARMQPLRASLDFLPMRLSGFIAKAEKTFPTACEELEMRKIGLEASYKKLEKDAESLRKELGEDRWLLVFRGAGRQAQRLYESVERSVFKLKEVVDTGMHLTNQPAILKKIESFDAKKAHYSPAIERILAMIEKGVRDRLTVNGEIMRLHMETRTNWDALKEKMREIDAALENIQANQTRSQQLRDSISSMLSNDMSTLTSGNETPVSSPSSVMSTLAVDSKMPLTKEHRTASLGSSHLPQSRRTSFISASRATNSHISRKNGTRLSTLGSTSQHPQLSTPVKSTPKRDNRPRWNTSTNTADLGVGHNFKPLTLTTPSPYARSSNTTPSITPNARASRLPTLKSPSSLSRTGSTSRANSLSPAPTASPTLARTLSRLSFRNCISHPGPDFQKSAEPSSTVTTSSMLATLDNRRVSLQLPQPATSNTTQSIIQASNKASTHYFSMLPQPKGHGIGISNRENLQAMANAKKSTKVADRQIPRWRY